MQRVVTKIAIGNVTHRFPLSRPLRVYPKTTSTFRAQAAYAPDTMVTRTMDRLRNGAPAHSVRFSPRLNQAADISDHYTPRIADMVELVNAYPRIFRPHVLPRVLGVVRLVNGFEEGRLDHPQAIAHAIQAQRKGYESEKTLNAYPLTIDVSRFQGNPEKIARFLKEISHNFVNVFIDPKSPFKGTEAVLQSLDRHTFSPNLEEAVRFNLQNRGHQVDHEAPHIRGLVRKLAEEMADQLKDHGETRTADQIFSDMIRLIPLYHHGRLEFRNGHADWEMGEMNPYAWANAFCAHLRRVGLDSKDGKIYQRALGNLVFGDGSAILGLSSRKVRPISGPIVTDVVNNGKSGLINEFGGVSSFHLSLPRHLTPEEIADYMIAMAPGHTSYNQEDITGEFDRAAKVFSLMRSHCPIFTFPDDMYGTAIVTAAALINAAKRRGLNKPIEEMKVCIVGAGAAGSTIANLLLELGVRGENLIVFDSKGAIHGDRDDLDRSQTKMDLARQTNLAGQKGSIKNLLAGADALIGVSVPGAIKPAWVRKMAPKRFVAVTANPNPECNPEELDPSGSKNCELLVLATGKKMISQVHNLANGGKITQLNNVLAFPGLFRGVHDGLVRRFDPAVHALAAAYAIAEATTEERLDQNVVTPPYVERVNRLVHQKVAEAIAGA